jgi:hypothetical protein
MPDVAIVDLGDALLMFKPLLREVVYEIKGFKQSMRLRDGPGVDRSVPREDAMSVAEVHRIATDFLKRYPCYPDEEQWEWEKSVMRWEEGTLGPGGTETDVDVLGHDARALRLIGGHYAFGRGAVLRVVVMPDGVVGQVEWCWIKVERWRRFATRSLAEAFRALDSGEGQLLYPYLRGGEAHFQGCMYYFEPVSREYVQPVYGFTVGRGDVGGPFIVPALRDESYASLPAATEEWEDDPVPEDVLVKRVRGLMKQSEDSLRHLIDLDSIPEGMGWEVEEQLSDFIRVWEQTLRNVTPATRAESASVLEDQARRLFEVVRANRLASREAVRPDQVRVMAAESACELMRSLSEDAGERGSEMLRTYEAEREWSDIGPWL